MSIYKGNEWIQNLIQELKQEEVKGVNTKRKQSALTQIPISDSVSKQIKETPVKKVKKNEEIKGQFEIDKFQWYEKSRNGKKFLKILDVPENIDQDVLKYEITGFQKQSQIKYLQSVITSTDQPAAQIISKIQEYLNFIGIKLKQYFKNKQLSDIQSNYNLSAINKQIQIDLLCENEQESLIVCLKHNQAMAEQQLKFDYQSSYLDTINALEVHHQQQQKQKNINLMIIPLNNLKNLRFIEFTKGEVLEIYKEKFYDIEFQKSQLSNLESKLEKQPQLLGSSITIFNIESKQSIKEFVKSILEQNDEQKLNYFRNLDNGFDLKFKNNQPTQDQDQKDLFEQYQIIHLMITSEEKRNKLIQNYDDWDNREKQKWIQSDMMIKQQQQLLSLKQNSSVSSYKPLYNRNSQSSYYQKGYPQKRKNYSQKRNYYQKNNNYYKKSYYNSMPYNELKYHMSYEDWYDYGLEDD